MWVVGINWTVFLDVGFEIQVKFHPAADPCGLRGMFLEIYSAGVYTILIRFADPWKHQRHFLVWEHHIKPYDNSKGPASPSILVGPKTDDDAQSCSHTTA